MSTHAPEKPPSSPQRKGCLSRVLGCLGVLTVALISVLGFGYLKQKQWDHFRDGVKSRVASHCKDAECEKRFEERLNTCLDKHTVSERSGKFNTKHSVDDATLIKCLYDVPVEQAAVGTTVSIHVAELRLSQVPLPEKFAHVLEPGHKDPDGAPTMYWTYATSELCRGNAALRQRFASRLAKLTAKGDEDVPLILYLGKCPAEQLCGWLSELRQVANAPHKQSVLEEPTARCASIAAMPRATGSQASGPMSDSQLQDCIKTRSHSMPGCLSSMAVRDWSKARQLAKEVEAPLRTTHGWVFGPLETFTSLDAFLAELEREHILPPQTSADSAPSGIALAALLRSRGRATYTTQSGDLVDTLYGVSHLAGDALFGLALEEDAQTQDGRKKIVAYIDGKRLEGTLSAADDRTTTQLLAYLNAVLAARSSTLRYVELVPGIEAELITSEGFEYMRERGWLPLLARE